MDTAVTLAHLPPGRPATIRHVAGERTFRRRLLELGLVPGTRVEVVGKAPLGDPLELLVRGCSLSIRRGEALCVTVVPVAPEEAAAAGEPAACGAAACGAAACAAQGTR